MDSNSPITQIAINVAAGLRDRSALPLAVKLPIDSMSVSEFGPPNLTKSGRSRALPCQISIHNEAVIAHWLLSPLKAGETIQYDITFGKRARHSQDRLTIVSTLTGYTATFLGTPLAEFFLPKNGVPRLNLRVDNVLVAGVEHSARPNWVENGSPVHGLLSTDRTLHRVRSGDPKCSNGTVFATVQAQYDYLDASDRVFVTESYETRFYPPERGLAVVDYAVCFRAIAGGVTIFDPDPSAHQRLPTLEVTTPRTILGWQSTIGAFSQTECARKPVSDIAVLSENIWLGMVLMQTSNNAPVVFQTVADNRFQSQPILPPATWITKPVRLALGEELRFDYRFVNAELNSFDWPKIAAQFVFPPGATCQGRESG